MLNINTDLSQCHPLDSTTYFGIYNMTEFFVQIPLGNLMCINNALGSVQSDDTNLVNGARLRRNEDP